MKIKPLNILAVILSLTLVAFLSIPLFEIIFSLPPSKLIIALKDKMILSSILLTLKVSAFATLTTTILGLPLSYILARYNFPLKGLIEGIVDVPVMIPHVAAGIALLMVFGSEGIFGEAFQKLGITFLDTQFGILIAMMFVSAPFFINAAKEGFKKIDTRIEQVARTLGASRFHVFLKISLPLAKKDILNGALMMWGRGLGEFGAVVIIAYHPITASVMIYDRFNSFGLDYALPVTTLLVIISLTIFIIVRFLSK
ncbi:ABC transporter permease [Hippea maritima]|uniref:ABC-type transporter, integral membrane subunit n=1 Tax=Hippea maritima (strain ATCC 700847 / DSM 10411 / MH2) TaxID=760142 RepID=F2LVG9_HIPMA|nr:ABC transporter permease [Hippea maritima]AEA33753.1 ABC-type transporter, integral membrane subunit [Hippea maritima DSM 10411]